MKKILLLTFILYIFSKSIRLITNTQQRNLYYLFMIFNRCALRVNADCYDITNSSCWKHLQNLIQKLNASVNLRQKRCHMTAPSYFSHNPLFASRRDHPVLCCLWNSLIVASHNVSTATFVTRFSPGWLRLVRCKG